MRGLNTNFELEKGAFKLSQGKDKSKNAIWFFCIFDRFRVYFYDFGGNFVSLQQRPVSYIIDNATILITKLRKGIQKYVPTVTIKDIQVGYMSTNRKEYALMIEYSAIQEDKQVMDDVTFV